MGRVKRKSCVRFALPASVIEENQNPYRTPKQISFMIEIANNIGATLTSLELPEIKDKQPNLYN